MPPNQGLRRVLSGFSFSSQKSRKRSNADGQNPGEPQSLAQVLSVVLEDDASASGSAQILNNDYANTNRTHAREFSSASAPLPDTTKSTPHVLRSASEPQQTATALDQPPLPYQQLARDKQVLGQRLSHIQLVLDQVKLDLLQATKEKHALKQQVHRQDEENQRIKNQLRDAKREYEANQSEIVAYAQVKADLLSANEENKRLKDDLEDTKRKLETTTSELKDTKTRFTELGVKHRKLDKSFKDSRHENDSLEIRLADATSQITTLTEEKSKAEEHMQKYRAFAQAIYKEIKPEQDKNRAFEAEITQLKSLLELKRSTLKETQVRLASLEREKETWGGRIDTMVHKISASERRIRMLHHAARTLEPQTMADSSGHRIRRGTNKKPNTSFSAEIVDTVSTLNKAILDAASNFTPFFFSPDSETWSGDVERAQVIFGEWVTSRLREEGWNRPWMLQSIIQIFLVDWCRAIIEAWYPKQQSFAELFLTGLTSQESSFKGIIEFQAFEIASNASDSSPDIRTWAVHILDDLLQVVPAPNMETEFREDILLPVLTNLARVSYDLRQALAEEDICGNVQLHVPPPDVPFQPDSMNAMDAEGFETRNRGPVELGDVVGSTSIGLRRMSIQKSDAGASVIHHTTILPPNVILARDMDRENSFTEVPMSAEEDFPLGTDMIMDCD